MRVWVDITDASAVVFFAPIVRRLEEAGHSVTLTARRFAGADLVLRRYGLSGVLRTGHRGGSMGTRAVGLVNRTAQLLGSASSGRFDVAAGGHASDFVFTAWTLAIPQMTFLDDDRLVRSNAVNVRLVDLVAVPDAVPETTLQAFGTQPGKVFRYPGFKEEYYLHDIHPDPDALKRLGVDRRHIVGIVRPAARERQAAAGERQTGADGRRHASAAGEHALVSVVKEIAGRRNLTLVVVARDEEQRQRFLALSLPRTIVPDGPVDGIGLLAGADFVLGLGGRMTREAAALGTPAYTVSLRPPAAVDGALLADGRLRRVTRPDDIVIHKKETRTALVQPRDPTLFVARLIELGNRRGTRARLGRLVQDVGDEHAPPLV